MPLFSSISSGSGGGARARGFGFGRQKPPFLYPFAIGATASFLPIVGKGSRNGPTLAQMQTAYSGQVWNTTDYFSMGTRGYQRWIVPGDGTYRIAVGGAAGGNEQGTRAVGATATADFQLTSGDQIEIAIGIEGNHGNSPHNNECGGGGGTFVRNVTNNALMIIAGGGGGSAGNRNGNSCNRPINLSHGQSGESGGNLSCRGNPGTATGGRGGYVGGRNHQGGAGGGWLNNGANGGSHCARANGGQGFAQGLVGGTGTRCYINNNNGGFGGGGGGALCGGGGGGGYSGGSTSGEWSSYCAHGGGGGSYTSAGTGGSAVRGGNTGSNFGYCNITLIS